MERIDREVDLALRDDGYGSRRNASGRRHEEILAAARRAGRRARGRRQIALAIAALALGGAVAGSRAWERAQERAERRARLVVEQQELQKELDDLKAQLAERSRVSLGGDDRTEIYIDLARLDQRGTTPAANRRSG